MTVVWSRLQHTPRRESLPGYFLLGAGVSCLVGIYGLRRNNTTMIGLRQDVYEADKAGGDVQGALSRLQHYVTSHMNTDLTPRNNAVYPPIQLRYTYERQKAAVNTPANNQELYSQAQQYCEQQNPTDFSGRNRVPCIADYVAAHGTTTASQEVPDSLYKFDFVSPSWSPDLAGWSLLLTVLFTVAAAAAWVHRRIRAHRTK